MKKIWIPIVFTAMVGLIGLVYSETKTEIAAKADNSTIMQHIQQQDAQRKEDREEQKEARAERKEQLKQQQEINQQVMQSIQMMLIQRATEKK